MSGTFEISDGKWWMPATWVFENATRALAQKLAASEPELSKELSEASSGEGMSYCNIGELDSERFKRFVLVLREVIEETIKAGPVGWYNPDFFPGYIDRLKDFEKMLLEDPRIDAAYNKA